MSSSAEVPPAAADDSAGPKSLVGDIRTTVSSSEFAERILVTALVTVSVGWLGIKAAVAAILLTQLLTESVKAYIRRHNISKKKLWVVTLLLLLLEFADQAWAKVARLFGHEHHPKQRVERTAAAAGGASGRAALMMSGCVVIATIAVLSVPEAALGHQLVGHRRATFFGGRSVGAITIWLPAPVTAQATSARGALVTFPTRESSRLTLRCSPSSGALFPIGQTTVRCVAFVSGKRKSGSFDVTVADTMPPRLQLPPTERVTTTSAATPVSFAAAASDVVDGPVSVLCRPASGTVFALGRTTVSCSATDRHGNRTRGSFTVLVARTQVASPVFKLPPGVTSEAAGPNGTTVTFSSSAATISGKPLPVHCQPPSGSLFPLGSHTVTCSASIDGHTFTSSFVVDVRDTTRPTLHLSGPLSIEASSKAGAVVTYDASASDVVSGAVAVSCNPASGTTLAIGKQVVSCSASDGAGNSATGSFSVVIFDAAPTISVPADINTPYRDAKGTAVTYSVTANDRIDGQLTPTCSPPSGSVFPVGKTTVSCTVTDSGGNTVTQNFSVSVTDSVPPAIKAPGGMKVAAPYQSTGTTVKFSVSAFDAIDGTVPVSCSPASGSFFKLGSTTVTCTATDKSGNTSVPALFTVYVYETPG